MASNNPSLHLSNRFRRLGSLARIHAGTWSLTTPGLQASETTILSNAENLKKFLRLPQNGQLIAEYIWIDSEGGTRSKSRVSFFLVYLLFFFAHWLATCFMDSSIRCHSRRILESTILSANRRAPPICPSSSLSARPKQPNHDDESGTISNPFPHIIHALFTSRQDRFQAAVTRCRSLHQPRVHWLLEAVQGPGLFFVAQPCEKCDRMTQLISSPFPYGCATRERIPAPSRLPTRCPADPRPKPKRH